MAAHPSASPSQTMFVLTYTPRADAQAHGYEDWLREIDNPFFNSDEVPELISSSNWLRTRDLVGTEWWTDFDLMFIDGPDGFDKLLANPKSAAFATNWATAWGNRPADGIPANFEAHILELVASPEKK